VLSQKIRISFQMELKRLYSEPKNRQAIRKTSLLTGIYYHLFMES
jgi:hypothetical protein